MRFRAYEREPVEAGTTVETSQANPRSLPAWNNVTGEPAPTPRSSYVGPGDADGWIVYPGNKTAAAVKDAVAVVKAKISSASWPLIAGVGLLAVAGYMLLTRSKRRPFTGRRRTRRSRR